MKLPSVIVVTAAGALLASCGGGSSSRSSQPPTSAANTTAPGPAGSLWKSTPLSPTAIPLGDGHVSTTPRVGYVDSCVTTFQGGGGATENGPWINTTNNTWNARTKLAVQGSITWSSAANAVSLQGTKRTLTTNDLPKGATTGTFPISPNDPAYQYDRNPNSITAQSFSWTVPANPSPASGPSCTPLGPIGMTLDGVVLLNALDAGGRDAVAHEIQDGCNGHPQQSGIYHYHSISTCLMGQASQTPNSSTLVGYALDGYGIYIERDAKGDLPTDADLDACQRQDEHGRVGWKTDLHLPLRRDAGVPVYRRLLSGNPVRVPIRSSRAAERCSR